MKLGVNIDHIAILRQARQVNDPDILNAMYLAIGARADQITIHLREDRRHIDDIDAKNIINFCSIPVNLECATAITDIVLSLRPNRATIVPEKRQELTTEGGLNLSSPELPSAIKAMMGANIDVSLFIDPNLDDIKAAKELGVSTIELHTGSFANAYLMAFSNISKTKFSIKSLENMDIKEALEAELDRIRVGAKFAKNIGLKVAAGHGLNYQNVGLMAKIPEIFELNIGQSIVARSVFVGLDQAIKEMKRLIDEA
ncbi:MULTISPECIES: pyridoxine 5'-phosphate synthase [Campylobacter]|uniref:pyridoxine 5'-phosphate synthase n=1 Tax=Campylobacter TaxID=194 RepID=UPI000A3309CB|nr:pyridoxine 5'-phosphate synthase [Campylobacter sp. P0024]MCR8679721.1 pyridoxine 5'-phosphate synthase [Campylobacter sp. RM19072]MEE3704947.1 pyridoxine 5'-phosphate synthase [Campylobacter sp. CX2-8023-23]